MVSAKICHLTSVHPPFDIRIFHKECRTLAAAGYDVTLLAAHTSDETVDGVKIKAVRQNSSRWSRATRTVWEVYRLALIEDADIYHIHDFELIPVALALKLKGKKIIYDSHEDFPRQNLSREWIPPVLRKPVAVVTEYFENAFVRFFDAVVGATPHISRRFAGLGCKVTTINNYPFLTSRPKEKKSACNPPRVCYVGAVSKARGIFEIVSAIEQTNNNLVIVGIIDGQIHDKLITMPGWQKVVHKGFLPHEEVAGVLGDCIAGLVVLHPHENYIYSQPTKMYEYMAAGIPVIASNFPLWCNVIDRCNCGVCVDPLNPEEVAAAIQWLTDHPEEARRMGANGRLAVEQYYNWEVEAKSLLGLYENLLCTEQKP